MCDSEIGIILSEISGEIIEFIFSSFCGTGYLFGKIFSKGSSESTLEVSIFMTDFS